MTAFILISSVYFSLHCERFRSRIVLTSFIKFNYARNAIFVSLNGFGYTHVTFYSFVSPPLPSVSSY